MDGLSGRKVELLFDEIGLNDRRELDNVVFKEIRSLSDKHERGTGRRGRIVQEQNSKTSWRLVAIDRCGVDSVRLVLDLADPLVIDRAAKLFQCSL